MHHLPSPVALLLFACALVGGGARAAGLDVQVRDASGTPVVGAVVMVHLIGQPTPAPHPAGTYVIDQQNIQFHPFVSAVPVGTSVRFMNHDQVRHHVYSFAKAKKFELRLVSRQQDQSVLFDKPGIVPLGCNIHDKMLAYVAVVDTPWAKTTDADGRVTLRNLPAGAVNVAIWHPYLRSANNSLSRTVALHEGGAQGEAFVAPLRAPQHDMGAGS